MAAYSGQRTPSAENAVTSAEVIVLSRPDPSMPDEDIHKVLLFALAAERLGAYYEHHSWMTIAQGTALAADWLARSKSHLPTQQRKHLSELSDQLARQIAETVSRQAGLHIAHEMNEALDQRYLSQTADSLLEECTRLLASAPMLVE